MGLVDVNTAMVGLCASAPDWDQTSDLMLHESTPLVHGPTILESHLTRAGSRLVVVSVDIYDGNGLTDMDELTDPIDLAARRHRTRDVSRASPRRRRPCRRPGIRSPPSACVDISSVTATCRPRRCSSASACRWSTRRRVSSNSATRRTCTTVRGRINGGVLGMVFQGAAEAAVPGHVGSDLHIHYLRECARRADPHEHARRPRGRRARGVSRPGPRRRRRRPARCAQATVTLQRYVTRSFLACTASGAHLERGRAVRGAEAGRAVVADCPVQR